MTLYYFICDKGHLFCFKMSEKGRAKFIRQCEKLLKVCSQCKPLNNKLEACEPPSINKFDDGKLYICSEGHQTKAGLFTNGIVHLSWMDQYENYSIDIETFNKQINNGTILCKHNDCKQKLSPVDDSELKPPTVFGIKTKVRVGDIWDKAKCPRPQASHYDSDNNYVTTEFDKRQKERLKKLRQERISKPAGKPITKPTKRRYKKND